MPSLNSTTHGGRRPGDATRPRVAPESLRPLHLLIDDGNAPDHAPGKEVVNQQLSLLSPLAVIVCRVRGPIPGVDSLPIDMLELRRIFVPAGEAGESVAVGENEAQTLSLDVADARDEVQQRALPLIVAGHPAGMKAEEHRGASSEIERDVLGDRPAGTAGDDPLTPGVLDIDIMNRLVGETVDRHLTRSVETSTAQESRQVLDVDQAEDPDSVELGHPNSPDSLKPRSHRRELRLPPLGARSAARARAATGAAPRPRSALAADC